MTHSQSTAPKNFWDQGADNFIEHATTICRALCQNECHAPAEEPRRWVWSVEAIASVCRAMNAIKVKDDECVRGTEMEQIIDDLGFSEANDERCGHCRQARQTHADIGTGEALDRALDFAVKTWPSFEFAQRASVFINVNQRLASAA